MDLSIGDRLFGAQDRVVQLRVDPEIEWLAKVLLWSLLMIVYLVLPARLIDLADAATRTPKRAILSLLLLACCVAVLEAKFTYTQLLAWIAHRVLGLLQT